MWHDRFPDKEFDDTDGDAFATKHAPPGISKTMPTSAAWPIRTGEEASRSAGPGGFRYLIETSKGRYRANNIVVATGARRPGTADPAGGA